MCTTYPWSFTRPDPHVKRVWPLAADSRVICDSPRPRKSLVKPMSAMLVVQGCKTYLSSSQPSNTESPDWQSDTASFGLRFGMVDAYVLTQRCANLLVFWLGFGTRKAYLVAISLPPTAVLHWLPCALAMTWRVEHGTRSIAIALNRSVECHSAA